MENIFSEDSQTKMALNENNTKQKQKMQFYNRNQTQQPITA
jgi:hypothetical protein